MFTASDTYRGLFTRGPDALKNASFPHAVEFFIGIIVLVEFSICPFPGFCDSKLGGEVEIKIFNKGVEAEGYSTECLVALGFKANIWFVCSCFILVYFCDTHRSLLLLINHIAMSSRKPHTIQQSNLNGCSNSQRDNKSNWQMEPQPLCKKSSHYRLGQRHREIPVGSQNGIAFVNTHLNVYSKCTQEFWFISIW